MSQEYSLNSLAYDTTDISHPVKQIAFCGQKNYDKMYTHYLRVFKGRITKGLRRHLFNYSNNGVFRLKMYKGIQV